MTPTEQEIEFFKEAKRIQELWEPRFGDLALEKQSGDLLVIVGIAEHFLDMVPMSWNGWEEGMIHSGLQKHLIFLPRPDQLWEMLEERGYRWEVRESHGIYMAMTWNSEQDIEREGPTPSIALGKCLLEVLEGGK